MAASRVSRVPTSVAVADAEAQCCGGMLEVVADKVATSAAVGATLAATTGVDGTAVVSTASGAVAYAADGTVDGS